MIKQYFTTIGKGHGAPCSPATEEDWKKWRNEPWLLQMCERIRKGDEQLKHRLPVWTPHCAEFNNNHRAIADALKPLNRLMLDFDEKGHTEDILARLNIEHGTLNVLLVEESVRGGTHVLVELPDGMEAEEAQELMKEVTGFEPDKAVKDVSRCIYMVPESYTRFVSERLFESLTPAPSPVERGDLKTSTNGVTPKASPTGEKATGRRDSGNGLEGAETSFPSNFEGIPYTRIIAEYWSMTGGIPTIGARNDKLHKLACNLRAICENKEDWLLEVMPRLGISEQEMKTITHSACKEPTKGSKIMEQIVKKLHAEDTEDMEENTSYFTLPAPARHNQLTRALTSDSADRKWYHYNGYRSIATALPLPPETLCQPQSLCRGL